MSENFFNFTVTAIDGKTFTTEQLKGQVTLVVNVASQCGYTPQYQGLETLYREFKAQGFTILGFPCNQFGFQEPGSDTEIQNFCKTTYDVSFPIMAKIDVNGDKAAPIYRFLKSAAPGILGTEAIKWNFTKFLIGKDGNVIHRYSPQTEPKEIAVDIKKALS